jgi:hypothetical protein
VKQFTFRAADRERTLFASHRAPGLVEVLRHGFEVGPVAAELRLHREQRLLAA